MPKPILNRKAPKPEQKLSTWLTDYKNTTGARHNITTVRSLAENADGDQWAKFWVEEKLIHVDTVHTSLQANVPVEDLIFEIRS